MGKVDSESGNTKAFYEEHAGNSEYLLMEINRDGKVFYSKWSKAIIPIFHWMLEMCQEGDIVLISNDRGTVGRPNRKVLYEIKVGLQT